MVRLATCRYIRVASTYKHGIPVPVPTVLVQYLYRNTTVHTVQALSTCTCTVLVPTGTYSTGNSGLQLSIQYIWVQILAINIFTGTVYSMLLLSTVQVHYMYSTGIQYCITGTSIAYFSFDGRKMEVKKPHTATGTLLLYSW